MGLDKALRAYPDCTNGTRLPVLSDNFPKYPLLNPATASANPSSIPMSTMENPMDFKNMGMMGYSISLAASVKRLMSESSQTERVMIFNDMKFFMMFTISFLACFILHHT
jgi:hypothetical protein